MFITAEDFNVRPYKLPNLDDEQIGEEFNTFTQDWEDEWLPKIFGRSFYNTFMAGVAALPPEWSPVTAYLAADETQVVEGTNIYKVIVDNTDSKPSATNGNWEVVEAGNRWLKIIKGAEYNLPVDGNLYKWPGLIVALKFAIFSEWLAASVNTVSGVSGEVTAQVENSELTSNAMDIARAWNKFARLIGGRTLYDKYDTLFGYLLSEAGNATFDDTFDESFTDFTQYIKTQFMWPKRLNPFNF